MKRPFVTLCIFLYIGIIGAHFLKYSIDIKYLLYIIVASVIVLLIYEKVFIFFLLLTITILGAYIYGQSAIGDKLLKSTSKDITMNVMVLKEGSLKNGFTEYEVEILNLLSDKTDKIIKVNKNAQLKVYGSQSEGTVFIVNDIVTMSSSKVKKILENMNDDKVNSYELYLKSKGIEYILETDQNSISINTDERYRQIGLRLASYKIKIYLEDFLDSTLDFENSDILKSIIFGNQGYLTKDKLDLFSKTGTSHIMAVSGLHVGLIVLIIDKFLKLIRIGRNKRLCFTVAILIFYAYMVYFPISIIRAGIMYMAFVAAYFLHRRYDSINTIFLVAFGLLLYRPMSIFSISFQLSFTATLSILVLTPILNEILSKKLGFLGLLLSVTVAAQIGTLPIMAYHFKQISIISLATNLLIVPLLAPMLSIAFISIIFGTISFRLGFILNQVTNQLLNYIRWISTKCAIIPYGSLEINEVKVIYIFIYYTILAMIYFNYKKRENMKKQKNSFDEEGLVNAHEL